MVKTLDPDEISSNPNISLRMHVRWLMVVKSNVGVCPLLTFLGGMKTFKVLTPICLTIKSKCNVVHIYRNLLAAYLNLVANATE